MITMKKTILVAAITVIITIVMAFTSGSDINNSTLKNSAGVQSGCSGDPASGNINCTSCHSGPAAQMQTDWITSDIPGSGYVPNTTYTVTATATGAGHTKFGFQVSPQNSSGTFLGTLVNTSSETKLISNLNYITHTFTGTSGSGSKIWTFDWTAPGPGSGEVTFYGAFNLTNNNNYSGGDTIMLSTLTLQESATSIASIAGHGQGISVFPNPANDLITIKTDNSITGSDFYVTNQTGRLVLTGKINKENSMIKVDQLAPGMYYVQIGQQNKQTYKVIKR